MKVQYSAILIAATFLFGHAAWASSPKDQARQQHQGPAAEKSKGSEQRVLDPFVPLSALQSSQSALLQALHAISTEEEAIIKQQRSSHKDGWDKAGIVADYLLFLIGCLYTYFAWGQWGAIKEQAAIANKALMLQFRPKLIVRNIAIQSPWKIGENTIVSDSYFRIGCRISGNLHITNVGNTKAEIIESGCWVRWIQEPLPMHRIYEGLDGNAPPVVKILEPGTSTQISFESEEVLRVNHVQLSHIEKNVVGWSVFVLGWIEYRDDIGLIRRTAFCRQWQSALKRFVIIDDPDYEYAE